MTLKMAVQAEFWLSTLIHPSPLPSVVSPKKLLLKWYYIRIGIILSGE